MPGGDLRGTTWKLGGYFNGSAMVPILACTEITVLFGADGRITGSAGCNTYYAAYSVASNGALAVGPIAVTEKQCAEPHGIMQQEAAYLTTLRTATGYAIEGTRLLVKDTSGQTALEFFH
jgi:heat shock protein HslJ